MTELIYHKAKMLLPGSFEELSAKQFADVAAILFTGGEEVSCKVKALKILSGLSAIRLRLLKPHIVNNAIIHIDWVFDRKKNITKQLIPCYRGFYGPESDFDNMRMKEFHMSERYFSEAVSSESEDDTALNNLVAVLYRPAKKRYNKQLDPDGDIRIDFNHNVTAYYANKIARWPLKVKQAIFLWYAGCRSELEQNNPWMFENDSDFESEFDTGLYGVMRNLAGDKLGPIQQIENMYVHTVAVEIGLIKEEEKYFEQKMKQNTA